MSRSGGPSGLPGLDGGAVGRRTFSTAFRGFDQNEVRAYLEVVATEFAALKDRISELELEVARVHATPAPTGPVDMATITAALGEETARVLQAAREAADERRARSEDEAERIRRDARDEAAKLRAAAETVLAERTVAASDAAAGIRREAEESAARQLEKAAGEAEATINQAITQGKDMLSQAQAARERVLSDLSRRRKTALTQIEQLRAGREQLQGALEEARNELVAMLDSLKRSEEEARRAAQAAAYQPVPDEPILEQLPAAPEPEHREPEHHEPGHREPDHHEPDHHEPGVPLAGVFEPADDAPAPEPLPAPEPEPEPVAMTPRADEPPRPSAAVIAAPLARRPDFEHDPAPVSALPAAVFTVAEVVETAQDVEVVEDLFARLRADRDEEPQADADAAVTTTSDGDEAYLQQRDVLIDGIVTTIGKAAKRALADDQNLALDRLRTSRTDGVTVDQLVGDEATHLGAFVAAVASGLGAAVCAGAALAAGDATESVDADALAAPVAERFASELIVPFRRRLQDLLADAAGSRGEETVDVVSGAYREWRGKIERLSGDAITEALAAGFGAALPAGTPVRWVVEDLDGPCPDCDDNALAEAVPLGTAFPTGQTAPPVHPGCRCVLARSAT